MNEDPTLADAIVAKVVPTGERFNFLPFIFEEKYVMRGEGLVFFWMGRLCKDYDGGFWHFYQLTNGGGYMAPADYEQMQIAGPENSYAGEMSADAAGIVATLFALNQLASTTEDDHLIEMYHKLRDYAVVYHKERAEIARAID